MRVKRRCGIQHRQRQSGEARACPDIRDRRTVQIGVDGQAVEQVVGHHVLTPGNGGEVIGAVPLFELVEKLQQARGVGLSELDSHALRVVGEAVNGAHRFAAILGGYATTTGGR